MRALLLALLLWQVAPPADLPPVAEPRHFRYQRSLTVPAGKVACAALDAAVYAHAAPSLKDLRVFRGTHELPYAITLSGPAELEDETATVRNLGEQSGTIVFDLVMPARPYTDVVLDMGAHNFIASAEVTGGGARGTRLGTFTLFDLEGQRLGRSTTLHLQESSFPLLHVALRFVPAPGTHRPERSMVLGAAVPPSREAQSLYTVVAETGDMKQEGRETVATLPLAARVPVERVSVALAPEFTGNFSRDVVVTAQVADDVRERLMGRVERIRLERGGREIHEEQMSFPGTLGANLQKDTSVVVRVDNGDDPPLPLRAVRLEMRERRVCLPAGEAGLVTVFYGDPALEAPRYDFARIFSLGEHEASAVLSAEQPNSGFVAREVAARSMMERHPELLWLALLGVVCVLAVVATHSAKRLPR